MNSSARRAVPVPGFTVPSEVLERELSADGACSAMNDLQLCFPLGVRLLYYL